MTFFMIKKNYISANKLFIFNYFNYFKNFNNFNNFNFNNKYF